VFPVHVLDHSAWESAHHPVHHSYFHLHTPMYYSSPTQPWLTSVSFLPLSPRCLWTYKLRVESSFMWAAWNRCLFLPNLEMWMTCFWLWRLWPSATP
jgi:hypothetical protein